MDGMFACNPKVGINDKRSGLITCTGKPTLYGFNQTDVFGHFGIKVPMAKCKLSPEHRLLASLVA